MRPARTQPSHDAGPLAARVRVERLECVLEVRSGIATGLETVACSSPGPSVIGGGSGRAYGLRHAKPSARCDVLRCLAAVDRGPSWHWRLGRWSLDPGPVGRSSLDAGRLALAGGAGNRHARSGLYTTPRSYPCQAPSSAMNSRRLTRSPRRLKRGALPLLNLAVNR